VTAVRVALLGLQLECSCVGKQRQSTRNCSRAASRLKLQGGMSSHLSCFPTYRLPVERTSKRISTQDAGTGVTRDARAGQAGELGSVVLCQSAESHAARRAVTHTPVALHTRAQPLRPRPHERKPTLLEEQASQIQPAFDVTECPVLTMQLWPGGPRWGANPSSLPMAIGRGAAHASAGDGCRTIKRKPLTWQQRTGIKQVLRARAKRTCPCHAARAWGEKPLARFESRRRIRRQHTHTAHGAVASACSAHRPWQPPPPSPPLWAAATESRDLFLFTTQE
jgi:hypothetical protein